MFDLQRCFLAHEQRTPETASSSSFLNTHPFPTEGWIPNTLEKLCWKRNSDKNTLAQQQQPRPLPASSGAKRCNSAADARAAIKASFTADRQGPTVTSHPAPLIPGDWHQLAEFWCEYGATGDATHCLKDGSSWMRRTRDADEDYTDIWRLKKTKGGQDVGRRRRMTAISLLSFVIVLVEIGDYIRTGRKRCWSIESGMGRIFCSQKAQGRA